MHELEVRLELVKEGRCDGLRGPEERVVVGELRKDDAEEEADGYVLETAMLVTCYRRIDIDMTWRVRKLTSDDQKGREGARSAVVIRLDVFRLVDLEEAGHDGRLVVVVECLG